jgi:Ni,Fe-hydrogenase maturation factor
MGADLPNDIIIVAIEAQNVYDFSEQLSPAVASAVPQAVELVIGQLVNRSTS